MRAAASAIASSGLRFALFAVLARLLPTDRVGEFSTAQWIAEMSALACSLGVTSVATRYLPQLRTSASQYRAFIRNWLFWSAAVTALAFVAGLCGSLWSFSHGNSETHLLVGTLSASSMAYALHLSSLTGLQRFDLILRTNIVFGVSALGSAALAQAIFGSQLALYSAMILSYLVAILCSLTPLTSTGPVNLQPVEGKGVDIDFGAVKSYALNSCLTGLLWALAWSRGELPFLVHFHNAEEVALFSAATVLAGGATQLTMLGVSALGPHLTQLWFAEARSNALTLARNAMALQLLLSGSVAVTLALLSREILSAAFGLRYTKAAPTLVILAMTIPALSVAAHSHLIQISTNGRVNRNVIIIVVLVLYCAAFILVPWLAGPGAAYARLIAVTVNFITIIGLSVKSFGIECVSLRAVMITVGACAIASLFSQMTLPIALRLSLLVAILISLLLLVKDSAGQPAIRLLLRQAG